MGVSSHTAVDPFRPSSWDGHGASRDLVEGGRVSLRTPAVADALGWSVDRVNHVLEEMRATALAFFQLPFELRSQFGLKHLGYIHGWRGPSDEQAMLDPDLVSYGLNDLNESVSFMHDQWVARRADARVARHFSTIDPAAVEIFEAVERASDRANVLYCGLAATLIHGCTRAEDSTQRFAPDALRHNSWIQHNYMDMAITDPDVLWGGRQMMQYVHRDGHLLTIGQSRKPGLEFPSGPDVQKVLRRDVSPDQLRGEPAPIGSDVLNVFVGDILTDYLAGDATLGQWHQVRFVPPPPGTPVEQRSAFNRYAPIYFCNPQVSTGAFPRAGGRGEVDVDAWARFQHRFGLPTIVSDPSAVPPHRDWPEHHG